MSVFVNKISQVSIIGGKNFLSELSLQHLEQNLRKSVL